MVVAVTRRLDGLWEAIMLREVLEQITAYANGRISTAVLQDWIVANMQRVLDSGDQEAIGVVNRFEVLFARLSEDLIGERDIFEEATATSLKARIDIRPLPEPVSVSTSGGSSVIRSDDPAEVARLVWAPG